MVDKALPSKGSPVLSAEGFRVLDEIFAIGAERNLALGKRIRVPTPGPHELYAYCELLAQEPREEDVQRFLEAHPGFLTGLLGGPDNADLAVLFKPPLGSRYRADFCVLQAHQGGCVANLIEIESSHEPLFNKAGSPARRLAAASKQIEDWRIFVSKDPKYHASELMELAKRAPLLADYKEGDIGFRLRDPGRVGKLWEMFGGYQEPSFHFVAIIGRWSRLSDDEKARVVHRNLHSKDAMKLYTFEQVARAANFRLERDEWNSEGLWGPMDTPIVDTDEP
jgi:hypothetical protein